MSDCQSNARDAIVVIVAVMLTACSSGDAGPLAGKWQITGIVPMTVDFRRGEEESLGVIEQVSYDVTGSTVLVHIESGPMKGTSMRYTVTSPTTLQAEGLGTLRRIQ